MGSERMTVLLVLDLLVRVLFLASCGKDYAVVVCPSVSVYVTLLYCG